MRYPAGTLDIAKAQDALYDWIKEATLGVLEDPIQIIWRNQSEPLPPRPCVTLKIISGPSPTDRDPSIFLGGSGAPNNAGIQMEAVLSIQVFGNTRVHRPLAHQLCVDINSSLMKQTVKSKLNQAGVSIQGKGNVNNLTALEETEYEERAGFDIDLGLAQNIADQPGQIQQVNVDRTLDDSELPTQSVPLP